MRVWIGLCLLFALVSVCGAAPLSQAQLQTLKTNILASPDLADELAIRDDTAIAAAYNQLATPDYWAWRTNLRQYDVYSLPSPTGSNWDWTVYFTLTAPEQGGWLQMFQGESAVANYALANIRAGVADLFQGAPPKVAQKDHIDAHGRRLVRRGERLYVAGTGSAAAPGTMAWEGLITATDISAALALP